MGVALFSRVSERQLVLSQGLVGLHLVAQLLDEFLLFEFKLLLLVLKSFFVGIAHGDRALVREEEVLFVDRVQVLEKAAIFEAPC